MNSQNHGGPHHVGVPCTGEFSLCPSWPRYVILVMWFALPAAHADEWRREDTVRELAFQALYAYDLQQNLAALRDWQHKDKRLLSPSVEHNAFLGRDSDEEAINSYFIITGLLHYSVSRMLPAGTRENWQWLTIGYVVSDIANNFRFGLRLTF